MLTLNVFRCDGTLVDLDLPDTTLFYDERIRIKLTALHECELHLTLTVTGHLPDRGREHSVVIYDGNLPPHQIWNEEVLVRHPRCPLQHPQLVIAVTIQSQRRQPLPSSEQLTNNENRVLLPFAPVLPAKSQFLTLFANDNGHLFPPSSVLATELVSPNSPASYNADSGSGQTAHWRAPLTPALELEIRSLRPALERDRVIAEINLACAAHAAQIDRCEVSLDGGIVERMGSLPPKFELRPFERLAIGYNLQLRASSAPSSFAASRRPLTIALSYEMLLGNCRAQIATEWTPVVDFESTQGPLPKTPALHLNISSPMPAFSTSLEGNRATSSLTLMGGVTILMAGPQFVRVGDQFEWEIKVMNRSQRHRVFTMTFGSIARDGVKMEPTKPANRLSLLSNYHPDQLRRRCAQQRRGAGASRGILPLCQELKVGNLAPHVCFETKVALRALTPGTHTVEDAKIEDSASRDSYDVGSLLEVIVEP